MLVQALYQKQISGHDAKELARQFHEHADYPAVDSKYFDELLTHIDASPDELDALITRYSDIPADQLDPVEHAILWVALAELVSRDDVPPKVVMNEAIELAKSFGAEGGHKFINGLLDKAVAESS